MTESGDLQQLSQHLPPNRRGPRLWFERLVIFREPGHAHCIRTIPFRRGLNIVWAKEPESGSARGTRAAGHGVGKTSLCLLLRFCLGDAAKTVVDLREELFSEFPQGGVAALLYVDDEPFTLCRHFNAHKEGSALAGDDLDRLWKGEGDRTYKEFEQQLADAMMACVSPKMVPETGQAIEWRHVLAWMTRDQGSRFKSFFAWREGEGTGLQRSRQDPPIVVRAVLGLLEKTESDLATRLSTLEQDLEAARQETARLQQEPALIRKRIESDLRAWMRLPDDLSMYSDDLFENSVARVTQAAQQKTSDKLAELETDYRVAQERLVNLLAEMKPLEQQRDRAIAEYELTEAARKNDETAFRAIADKIVTLKQLPGQCEHGGIAFQECQHIRNEIDRLHASDMKNERDKKALERAMGDAAARSVAALSRKTSIESQCQALRERVEMQERECKKISMTRDSALIDADRGKNLLSELERWERSAGSADAQAAIERSRDKITRIERDIASVNVKLATLQAERSLREQHLSEVTDVLARELLPDGASGFFNPRDDSRPFCLSMRGGEAYRVLEVLLGDWVCLLDSGSQDSAFPGFVIHDCPREADMSSGLYENFILLVERLQTERYGEHVPYQYIVTTTTPPPVACRDERYLRLELDPSMDDGLLFRKRLG